jgi:hypothetical protein
MLSVPLVSGGNVIGIVNVHRRKPHEYTSAEKPTSACEIKAAASSAP